MIKHYNPNPTCKFFKSGKPKNWYINDSSVRAVAKVFDKSWEYAYDVLSKTGLTLYDVPTSKQTIHTVLERLGFEFVTLGKPKKGESRPTVKEFIENVDKNSIYVLNLADYFVTVIDGDIYDVSDECLKSSVYSYWIKSK
jgi:hypothetical protein